MKPLPPISTLNDTLFPYTTLFRSRPGEVRCRMQLAPIRETGPGLLNSGSEFGEAWLLPPAREHRVPTRSWSIPALFARGGRCTLRGARKSLRPAWAACKPVVGIEVAVECVKAGSEPCFSVAYEIGRAHV